jgi:hypothetical protein
MQINFSSNEVAQCAWMLSQMLHSVLRDSGYEIGSIMMVLESAATAGFYTSSFSPAIMFIKTVITRKGK